MKREVLFIVLILLFLNLVSAKVEIGNLSHDITNVYGKSQVLEGWINISLDKEPSDSLLKAFNKDIELKEFLDENLADYNCFPLDCESFYSIDGNSMESKQFSLNSGETKLLGIRISGKISDISSIEFDIKTNAGKSCSHPLKIDILDDGIDEWKAENLSNDFSCTINNNYGCYKRADNIGTFLITDHKACEKIVLPESLRSFEIGADILKGVSTAAGNVNLKMSIDNGNEEKECDVIANASGKVRCIIQFENSLEEDTEADVCIRSNPSDNGKYEINYENIEPCGHVEDQDYDFSIFVNGGKYSPVKDFKFSQDLIDTDLRDMLTNYIFDKYNGNCTPACIIPIGLYSGVGQSINISNLILVYNIGISEKKFYDIKENTSLISSDFQKLDLEKANFTSPSDFGTKNLILRLGDKKIFEQEIEVKPVPEIRDIVPHDPSALVPVNFLVLLEEAQDNLTYTWDFGDGSPVETTTSKSIKHVYPSIDVYELKVEVSNEYGKSTKVIQIDVKSPKESIQKTIDTYKENIDKIKSEINNLDSWVQGEIEKKINLENLSNEIEKQEKEYDEGFIDDDKAIQIMSRLLELEVPYELKTDNKISSPNLFIDENQLDLTALEEIGAGEATSSREEYFGAINTWIRENLDIKLNSETYFFNFENKEQEPLISYIKLELNPKQELNNFFLIINGDPSEIKIKENLDEKELGDALGVIFSVLSSSKKLEILYPGEIDFFSLPFYVSPEFKDLGLSIKIDCNANKICEKELGENSENCRSDCKPLGKTILLLVILVFVAFIVYIFLQEWYKRHYESHLFSNKTQLFNLINFINNSLNQGLKKSEIFNKLKEMDWNNEQLNYIWNKYQGKRTGMWEIPVFKWVENRKVKEEIKKRQGILGNENLSLR